MGTTNFKPCPFCGGEVEFTECLVSGEHEIECGTCPFISYWPVDWATEQVQMAWNARSAIRDVEGEK